MKPGIADGQEQQFQRRLIGRETAARLDDLAQTVNRHRTGTVDVFGLSVWSDAQNHRSAGVYAEMVGAVSLARAIQDPDQAAEIRYMAA
jgi:hypothetical protein